MLNADGKLDRIIYLSPEDEDLRGLAARLGRRDNSLYAVRWDIEEDTGHLLKVDLETDRLERIARLYKKDAARLYVTANYYYPNFIPRKGDILVTDQVGLKVKRLAMDGSDLGDFGR